MDKPKVEAAGIEPAHYSSRSPGRCGKCDCGEWFTRHGGKCGRQIRAQWKWRRRELARPWKSWRMPYFNRAGER